MPSRRFLAAAVQMNVSNDRDANLAACTRLCAEAAERGAHLVVLPENFAFLGRTATEKLAVAETIPAPAPTSLLTAVHSSTDPAPAPPGPILTELARIAKRHHIWLIGGGMAERLPDDGPADPATHTYNTCVVIGPDGQLAARYRKIHLFDFEVPGKPPLCESHTTAAGREAVVCETPLARIGLTICYDLRFPELYRDLAINRGAQVLIVPSAFTVPTGIAHWHTLLQSRAIENQCYVIAPAQAGRHNEHRSSYGHSVIVGPWGNIGAEIESDDILEGVAIAEIDLNHLDRIREKMPCHQHAVLID